MSERNGRRAKDPAFQVYPSDALSDVGYLGLSAAGRGVFWDLLLLSWLNDGLPDDARALHVLCRCSAEEWSEVAEGVLELFPVAADGKRRNARQEREREARAAYRAGKAAAARSRWEKRGDASAMHVHPLACAKPMPPIPIPNPIPKKTPLSGGAGGAEAPSPAGAGSPRAKAPPEKALDLEAWLATRPAFATERFRKAWAAYVEHRGRGPARSRLTLRAAELALSKLEPLGHEGAAACLEQSVMNGWQGVFPERQNGHARGVPPPDDGRQEAWDQAIAERAARRARWTTR